MKYLSLALVGFERMALNNIRSFTIEPTEPIQLILGTNGSGKSSLLYELTPLPANKDDYTTDGSKTIVIEHHGAVYTLKSDFESKHTHSFIYSGEELNKSGLITTQKDLVKEHFGITADIQALLLGIVAFSSMSPGERRTWFTRLSDTNYDYAIAVYRRLQERHRDITGAIKLAKNKLVTETAKIMSLEEITNLRSQVEVLHNFLQHLLEYRRPIDKRPEDLAEQARDLEKNIETLFVQMMRKKMAHQNRLMKIPDAVARIQELENSIVVEKKLLDIFFEEHKKLDSSMSTLKETGGAGVNELRSKCDNLTEQMQALQQKKTLKLDFGAEDPLNVSSAFTTVYDTLSSVFVLLPENPDRRFSKANLERTSLSIDALKNLMTKTVSDLNKVTILKQAQEHNKEHDVLTCPACSHKWARGFDQATYDALLANEERLRNQIDEATISLQEVEGDKQSIVEYSEIYKQFSTCAQNWPILRPLWTSILDSGFVSSNPRKVLGVLEAFRFDIGIDLEIHKLRQELKHTESLIEMAQSVGNADMSKISESLDSVVKKIEDSTAKVQDATLEAKKLATYKKDMEDVLQLSEDIDLLGRSFTLCYTEHAESFRRGALIEAIRTVQSVLAKKEAQLSEVTIQEALIAQIRSQISAHEEDDIAYRMLIKELSPTDGLIADGLTGFINTFVKHMNVFIDRIWMYPLKVIPCGMNSDGTIELDYKFPLDVSDGNKRVPDVKQGSTAMREVVDLAFKITAMKYLGIEDSPLALDEFGASFDSAHRLAGIEAVKTLMEHQPFTQLFMVNHHETSYGALTNAQVCSICSSNIVIPKGAVVNSHVRME